MAIKDLTPKSPKKLLTAEEELTRQWNPDELPFGSSQGGVSMFSNKFVRGYGEDTFGVSEEGVWLGGAEFESAVVRQSFDGQILIFDKETGLARVLIGYQEDGF